MATNEPLNSAADEVAAAEAELKAAQEKLEAAKAKLAATTSDDACDVEKETVAAVVVDEASGEVEAVVVEDVAVVSCDAGSEDMEEAHRRMRRRRMLPRLLRRLLLRLLPSPPRLPNPSPSGFRTRRLRRFRLRLHRRLPRLSPSPRLRLPPLLPPLPTRSLRVRLLLPVSLRPAITLLPDTARRRHRRTPAPEPCLRSSRTTAISNRTTSSRTASLWSRRRITWPPVCWPSSWARSASTSSTWATTPPVSSCWLSPSSAAC